MGLPNGKTELGNEILNRLVVAKLTQEGFCKQTGMKPATLSSLINGGTELNNNHISQLRLVLAQDVEYWIRFRPNKISKNMSAKDPFNSSNTVTPERKTEITVKTRDGYEVKFTADYDDYEHVTKMIDAITSGRSKENDISPHKH